MIALFSGDAMLKIDSNLVFSLLTFALQAFHPTIFALPRKKPTLSCPEPKNAGEELQTSFFFLPRREDRSPSHHLPSKRTIVALLRQGKPTKTDSF